MTSKTNKSATLEILEISQGCTEFLVVGQSPLICNAMSAKTRQELLLPKKKMTSAEKAINLKHDPLQEFRDSIYRDLDPEGPTLITLKATAFKKATMGAALDIPGAAKAQIGRLMYVVGDEVPIYGIPQLMMSVVRSKDMNRTPDVRSRVIIPTWCAKLSIEYTEPMLKAPVIAKLMGAAGKMQGVGDWRVEKGSGNYGRFELVEEGDLRFDVTMAGGGREVQIAAMESPEPYDSETQELMSWYKEELFRRGFRKEKKAA